VLTECLLSVKRGFQRKELAGIDMGIGDKAGGCRKTNAKITGFFGKYLFAVFFYSGKIPNLAELSRIFERIVLIIQKQSVLLGSFEPAIFKSSEYWLHDA
jgi:hypothetical protein